MQYTLRQIPEAVDRLLRRRAAEEGASLNEVAIAALARGLGIGTVEVKHRHLGDIVGSWVSDPETDASLDEQRRLDPDLWR
ncbi:MAG: hypothetical protein H0V89_05660 [Deltaproteobacteria bacterium]|nr:hypothetical protein [Deltaproteobacteria bacterium]